jgi:Animal haem peroxidase
MAHHAAAPDSVCSGPSTEVAAKVQRLAHGLVADHLYDVKGERIMTDNNGEGVVSRRRLLAGAGAAGAGLAAASAGVLPGLAAPARAAAAAPEGLARRLPPGAPANSMLFGRIFPGLPPFAADTSVVQAALLEVGMQGGIMDAQDDLAAGPKALIVDPTVNGNPTAANPYGTNPDNPTMTAGSTFVGQFTDHDITFDQTSQLGITTNPLTSPNTRTPALDLDSVFGGGPKISPNLYVANPDGSAGPALKIGTGGVHEDIPRTPNGDGTFTAILSDPRNDENVMIAGLHSAHILFYNRVLAELGSVNLGPFPSARGADTAIAYVQYLIARELTLWHYQWLLVNEHLPQIAGQAMVNDVLANGNKFYRPPPGDAFMPIEFGGACYRFGHSQVRPSYRANFTSGTGDSTNPAADPFFGLVFDATEPEFNGPINYDRDDLLGGYPAPNRYIGWQTFFDLGDGQVKNNKKIDTTISSVMFTLPVPAIAPHTQTSPTVLPQRNLLRQLTWSLPSGQSIAAAMGVTALTAADLADIGSVYAPFATSTPLWYYMLAEAKLATGGLTLGPVGGRIVAETLIGLLRADPTSYLSVYPRFTPFLGTDLALGPTPDPNITGNRSYTRANFLYYAGVVEPGIYR